MSLRSFIRISVATLILGAAPAVAAGESYAFGVINQRSIMMTAEFWNPILRYVGEQSGVELRLSMGRTAPETTAMTLRGEHAFAYTNHLFTPERDALGWRVILRMEAAPIRSVIVVREESPLDSLEALHGLSVAFPSREAFVGYWVPMDELMRQGVQVEARFAGNQEGAMAQLQAGRVAAAAVNEGVLQKYARREGLRYRVLWTSEPYLGIPVMAGPAVPAHTLEAVRGAFLGMARDPRGREVLEASAAVIKQAEPIVFVPAQDSDYDNYRRFFRETRLVGE